MTTATKCIAVKTPFGPLYLELMENGEQYKMGCDDAVTNSTYDKLTIEMKAMLVTFYVHDAEWISVFAYNDEGPSFLPITSNYGDQFPQ